MFAPYPQANNPNNIPGLTALVNQFNHNYAYLAKPNGPFHNAPNPRKILTLDNLEMQLMHIINQASGSGVSEDLMWLGAHRREINQAIQQFTDLRTRYGVQRNVAANQHVQGAYDNVRNANANARQTVGSAAVTAKSVTVSALLYGGPALAVGGTATGLSAAFSFFGGPVGIPFTATVGAVSAIGVAGATAYGAIEGARADVETSLRRGVGLN